MQTLDASKDGRSDARAAAGELPSAAGLDVPAAAINVQQTAGGVGQSDSRAHGVADRMTRCVKCGRRLTREPVYGMGPVCAKAAFGSKPKRRRVETVRDRLTRDWIDEVRQ